MDTSSGIVLVDKPVGISSHAALKKLREKLGIGTRTKVGHAGTLDPNASGLLLIGVGEGTKRLKEYVGLPKTYEADILLGKRTTTSDIKGEVIETATVPALPAPGIEKVLESMVGILRLPVSAFSATKRGGEALYKKAHRGEDVGTLPLRDMEVYSAIYRSSACVHDTCVVKITFRVDSGVYVRSLAEEFGRRLGYPATLKKLRRTQVGDFSVDDAEVLRL
jgi:tRNA pseudouridine55 synthase